ncbi:MAG TPA: glutamate 5-kinase, partial [Desulfuromonadales bacterium]|nr:glutamate 5-kinase [Desulfuromonadales bacterium]
MRKNLLSHAKRVVIKIGSGVLSTAEGLNESMIVSLAGDIDVLLRRGYEIILVSSGAVAA